MEKVHRSDGCGLIKLHKNKLNINFIGLKYDQSPLEIRLLCSHFNPVLIALAIG